YRPRQESLSGLLRALERRRPGHPCPDRGEEGIRGTKLEMSPEHLLRVEELYHSARECRREERAALLNQADPEIRAEVELLLAQDQAEDPMGRPVMEVAAKLMADSTVTGLA